MDAAVRDAVEKASAAGSTSVHSTGVEPWFITEAAADAVVDPAPARPPPAIDEYADLSQRNSPELLFDVMGFWQAGGHRSEFRAEYP